MTARRLFGLTSVLVIAAVAAIAIVAGASAGNTAANPHGLKNPGTLTVGMTLQFKPQMYLDSKGKPAGYDVVLLKALAKQWGVKLDIKNLDFNGLIPGLVAKKFDMVSVGLSATPERRKSISFSRAYVPYAQILAAAKSDTTAATVAAWNTSDKTITSLQGSTAEQLVKKTFPNATSLVVPRPERGVPRGRDGPCERHRGRELPPGAVQQVERQQAQGSAVPEAAARRVRLVRRPEGQHEARRRAERVHLQAAEERPAGRDLQVDHRRASAADAGLQVTHVVVVRVWPAALPPATRISRSQPLASV